MINCTESVKVKMLQEKCSLVQLGKKTMVRVQGRQKMDFKIIMTRND